MNEKPQLKKPKSEKDPWRALRLSSLCVAEPSEGPAKVSASPDLPQEKPVENAGT